MSSSRGRLDVHEQEFKKRALKDAALCIGWFKMMSVTFYISLYFLVFFNDNGDVAYILMILLLVGIIPSVFLGLFLFLGALKEYSGVIYAALITCILLATYDLIVGTLGAVYYVSIAEDLCHYILTMACILLALTCFPTYCHDVFVINTYRKLLKEGNCEDDC